MKTMETWSRRPRVRSWWSTSWNTKNSLKISVAKVCPRAKSPTWKVSALRRTTLVALSISPFSNQKWSSWGCPKMKLRATRPKTWPWWHSPACIAVRSKQLTFNHRARSHSSIHCSAARVDWVGLSSMHRASRMTVAEIGRQSPTISSSWSKKSTSNASKPRNRNRNHWKSMSRRCLILKSKEKASTRLRTWS